MMNWKGIVLAGLALMVAVALLGASQFYQQQKICRRINIEVASEGRDYDLDLDKVREIVGVDRNIDGARIREINLSAIERRLLDSRYIRQADAYFSSDESLDIRIEIREPIARVFCNGGRESFYVDAEGVMIPISRSFQARTILLFGEFERESDDTLTDPQFTELVPLLEHIRGHRFWRAQLSELYVEPDSTLLITTEVGDTRIRFGRVDRYREKLENLLLFYDEVLQKVGWEKYSTLNLSFRGQIVATRRSSRPEA